MFALFVFSRKHRLGYAHINPTLPFVLHNESPYTVDRGSCALLLLLYIYIWAPIYSANKQFKSLLHTNTRERREPAGEIKVNIYKDRQQQQQL